MSDPFIRRPPAAGLAFQAGRVASPAEASALKDAEEIRKAAQDERVRVLEEAQAEGRRQGREEWDRLLTALASARDTVIQQAEQDVLRLSVHIARKLLGEDLRLHPDQIRSIVRTALTAVKCDGRITVKVNPQDAGKVRDLIETLAGEHRERRYELVPDHAVKPGGCEVETEAGRIDAQLDTQFSRVEQSLLKSGERQ